MPRRREVPKRGVMPDGVYESELCSRIINKIMARGKKSLAEQIFYQAMDLVKERTGEDPMKILKRALDNIRPIVETKARRVGGSTYQVPIEINSRRRTSLGIRWLVSYARGRSARTMTEKLANEILEASSGRSSAVRKKEDVHRMAESNKAFAHYRW